MTSFFWDTVLALLLESEPALGKGKRGPCPGPRVPHFRATVWHGGFLNHCVIKWLPNISNGAN